MFRNELFFIFISPVCPLVLILRQPWGLGWRRQRPKDQIVYYKGPTIFRDNCPSHAQGLNGWASGHLLEESTGGETHYRLERTNCWPDEGPKQHGNRKSTTRGNMTIIIALLSLLFVPTTTRFSVQMEPSGCRLLAGFHIHPRYDLRLCVETKKGRDKTTGSMSMRLTYASAFISTIPSLVPRT